MTLRPTRLAALILTLAACAPPPVAVPTWRLATLNGAPLPGTATLAFQPDGTMGGQAPCNLWSAVNTANAPAFRLTPIVTTERACLSEGGEAAFLDALARARRIDLTGDRLTLSGPGVVLDFVPEV